MNSYALNGSALNGATFVPLAGSATFDNYVNVAVAGTRVVNASATCDGYAGFTATGLRTAGVAATIDGYVNIVNAPKFIQAASATFDGYGDLRATVLRSVPGTANFDGHASFIAIPASTLGSANITGSATITATGTRVQPGAASASAGSLAFTPTGKVTRYVSASVNAAVDMRVEAQKNHAIDGFATFAGVLGITVPDIGIVFRQSPATFDGYLDIPANPTYIFTSGATLDNYCDGNAVPTITSVPDSVIDCYGSFTAQATRLVLGAANFPVTVKIDVGTGMGQAGTATFDNYVSINAPGVRVQTSSVVATGTVDMSAAGVVLRMVQANLTSDADSSAAAPIVIAAGVASVNSSAAVTATPTRLCLATIDGLITPQFTAFGGILNQGGAAFAVAGDLAVANPKYFAAGAAKINCIVSILAGHTRVVQGQANFTPGSSGSVSGRLNVEATDPPDRTFYRPALDNTLHRPFVDTELRRYA